jgi:hypothetical protein
MESRERPAAFKTADRFKIARFPKNSKPGTRGVKTALSSGSLLLIFRGVFPYNAPGSGARISVRPRPSQTVRPALPLECVDHARQQAERTWAHRWAPEILDPQVEDPAMPTRHGV